jgi:hypothetical protein
MNSEDFYAERMEKTAFLFGAAAIPLTFLFPIVAPFLLGSMAMVFAYMSKGGNLRMSKRGRTAFFLGLAAVIINVVYMGLAFRTMNVMLTDPEGRQQLNDILYRQYGMTLDELLSQIPMLQ